MAKDYFPKVKEARAALAAKALELYEQYEATIKDAIVHGHFEVALDNMKWLMEHMPADDGVKMLDGSVDKQATQLGPAMPTINIGFALGGIPSTVAPLATAQVEAPFKVLNIGAGDTLDGSLVDEDPHE